MKIHVLPGDSLVNQFEKAGIEGEVLVCRECLVDGPLEGDNLEEFWSTREKFLSSPDTDQDYRLMVTDEMIRLRNLAGGKTVNLWFEYELFCQVNLWFTIWLLRNTDAQFRIVYPKIDEPANKWKGFGYLDIENLIESEKNAVHLSRDDVSLAVQLWEAFQKRDFEKLTQLGKTESDAFPTLAEVCEAACAIDTRPANTIRQIISEGKSEFGEMFREFGEREGVYGFGDLQVKRIFDEIVKD